ncbi:hypothetical protein Pla110_41120 [Polystyrenella longa]|uniref:Flavohemoglobin expression-modulating QEGLA motif protein n=1 Tax=Polystyrenella longa TaxID=2528007 RepID=A0A518CT00_9PLAN|nr:flavohemoglobin expression-modulating QEGLA motif protein [Polystyrenella longa]QDU82357.1 hypothetical protein Pla110_41120 [Polystyrenella longa]
MIDSDPESTIEDEDRELRYQDINELVQSRLSQNQRIRRNLPGDGRLRIDRQLPFLCVYRTPPDRSDPGTVELVTTEAAYLFASGDEADLVGVTDLCQKINSIIQEHFGTFLLIEIWSEPRNTRGLTFEIVSPDVETIPSTIDTLHTALSEIKIRHERANVVTRTTDVVTPPGLPPLNAVAPESNRSGFCVLGLSVSPIYRDPQSGAVFPMILHSIRHQLAAAIRKTVAQFTGTENDPSTDSDEEALENGDSYHSLGPSSLVKAARLVDQQLGEVSESFDFLLQVTPTNTEEARQEFYDSGCKKTPRFIYRPLPYRPSILKRRLFDIEIERIEDPTLAHILWEKQEEIDRKLSALRDLDTPEFLYNSLQLYGSVQPDLLHLSREILNRVSDSETLSEDDEPRRVLSGDFIERARDEFDYYHLKMNEFNATVEECDEIAAGIMVSHGRLLVSKNLNIPAERVEPLLHHEIGTHLLTYFNGRCQPFRQLYAGLAGYEELQEGLAVLSEYLVGGLTTNRVGTLAGRVVAVDSLTKGNSFAQTFEMLHHEFGFSQQRSFTITLRVYRGGGLTKDVIYLRGLVSLLKYLSAGHDIEPLYVGKIGLHHVPYVQELRRRKIIVAPRILPRFWDDDKIRERLDACRNMSVLTLLETN